LDPVSNRVFSSSGVIGRQTLSAPALQLRKRPRPAKFLCVAGLGLCIGRSYSRTQLRGAVTVKEGQEQFRGFISAGVHPIYTGLIAKFFSTVIVLIRAGIAGLSSCSRFWINHAKRRTAQTVSDQYAAYQRRVKRIIPFVLSDCDFSLISA
jgi:protein-S-isoprenylcysteine O-methyltransferase Ste14